MATRSIFSVSSRSTRDLCFIKPGSFVDVGVVGLVVADLDVVPLAVVEGELGILCCFFVRRGDGVSGGQLCLL